VPYCSLFSVCVFGVTCLGLLLNRRIFARRMVTIMLIAARPRSAFSFEPSCITLSFMTGAQTIGIYNKDCIDGSTAAAVLYKKIPHAKLPTAILLRFVRPFRSGARSISSTVHWERKRCLRMDTA
jgi:hypothetical protein